MVSANVSSNAEMVEKAILLGMSEGVITLECTGNVFMVNPAALRILGYSKEEMEGKNFRSLFKSGNKNQSFINVIDVVLSKGSLHPHIEIVFHRPDGQTVDLSISGSSLVYDVCEPSVQNVVLVFRDVTAFKSLQRARMRAVNHLAHEITTPLAIVQATVEHLMQEKDLPETMASKLNRIQRNTHRLLELRDVLEETLNPLVYNPTRMSVKRTLEMELDTLRPHFSHRFVQLTLRVDELSTDLIDPRTLRLIFQTLVKNAIENTPDQGEIYISMAPKGEGILLSVEDRGIGIPIAEQPFVFEAFHNIQLTDDYATKKPFDFNAGGKGLELFRLKVLSETVPFRLSFQSQRCHYIPSSSDLCPGDISKCPHIAEKSECFESGGSCFEVLFTRPGQGNHIDKL